MSATTRPAEAAELTRTILLQMLETQKGLQREADVFTPGEGVQVELLLRAAGGGPVPLSRVERLTLHDAFVLIDAFDATTLLTYGAIAGLRVSSRERSRGTGFTR